MDEPPVAQVLLSPVPVVTLVSGGTPIVPPEGMVYSTDPRSWSDEEGTSFVVKGPDTGVVAAECVAHQLAETLSISVPPFALARIVGQAEHSFASRKLNIMRDASPWLRRGGAHLLRSLATIVLFDIWIANKDRNLGNVLARRPASGEADLELVAIDFEKAVTIRGPHPLVETPMVNPQELWPREELGRLLAGTPIPQEPLVAIASLPAATISRSVEAVAFHLGGAYTWAYSTIQVLRNRQGRMNVLAEEVWR